MESFDPIDRGNASLKEKRTKNVVDRAEDAFCATVLLRGVWTRHAEGDAVREEIRARGRIVELAAIVALDAADNGVELSANVGKEVGEGGENVRLEA